MSERAIDSKSWVPPFIVDQHWSLLDKTSSPKRYLKPEQLRGDKFSQHSDLNEEQWEAQWQSLNIRDRDRVALNTLIRDGEAVDLQYTVLTTDAGVGKTKSTEWLDYRLSCPDSPFVSFRFSLSRLIEPNGFSEHDFSTRLLDLLAGIWRNEAAETISIEEAAGYIAHCRDTGKLCLILDSLDELSQDPFLIRWLMKSPKWDKVRLIIAGRPNALFAHWEEIFEDHRWRYVQIESFFENQQDRYLGPAVDQIPTHVLPQLRPIMRTPRVLEYLLQVEKYNQVRTAADIYFLAIENILQKGILNSNEAATSIKPSSQPGTFDSAQITNAFTLLSAIAFETLVFHHDDPTWGSVSSDPQVSTDSSNPVNSLSRPEDQISDRCRYAEHIDAGGEFTELKSKLRSRWNTLSLPGDLDDYLPGLAALGDILENGTLAAGERGLKQVKFTNRSLHEFLAAYFFSTHARPEDQRRLWDWIYLKDNAETDAYYYFWQYLCEMPDGERVDNGPRNPHTWLNSISILFQPCQCDESIPDSREPAHREPTRFFAKRSTEMMFRCWESLQAYRSAEAKPKLKRLANQIFMEWIGEFERITAGDQGEQRRLAATGFKSHLMRIEGGSYRMGTSAERQGVARLTEKQRNAWRRLFDQWQEDHSEVERWLSDSYRWPGRSGRVSKSRVLQDWLAFVRRNDFEGWLHFRWPADETPSSPEKIEINDFHFGRTTVSNLWFRLFDPGHFQRPSELWNDLNKVAPTSAHPAVYISWFDAFIAAQWFHWNGESCRLPWEDEWEYVAKLGLSEREWYFRYWWGDRIDSQDHGRIQCKETRKDLGTIVPTEIQSSPATREMDDVKHSGEELGFGISCLLGNTWEWCQDNYRQAFELTLSDCPGSPVRSRVVRGGSFNNNAEFCTCSIRDNYSPALAVSNYGFRVARVPRKNLET